MENKLQFLTVSEKNISQFAQGISDLHFARHKQRYAQAYWQWRYLDGPAGPSSLIVALRQDKIVGQYGISYLPLIQQGKSAVAGLMGSLSIASAEKSWQCYRGLVKQSMLDSKQKNLIFRFGLAPLRTMKFTQRMGVKRLGRMPICFGLLDADKFLRARRLPYPLSLLGYIIQPLIGLRDNLSRTSDLDIKSIELFDDQFDQLWEEIAKDRYSGYVKNAAYLNWRYTKCPLRKYYKLAAYKNKKLKGFIVFCLTGIRDSACVLELIADEYDIPTMRCLLSAAFKHLQAKNIGSITASFFSHTAAAIAARSLGFKFWSRILSNSQMLIAANTMEDEYLEQDFRKCEFSLGDWLEF